MSHVILTQTGTCGFTLNAKVKRAPFACKKCGSRKFRAALTMTAEAYPTWSSPDGTCPVIHADMDVYAITVQCRKCGLTIPGPGYTKREARQTQSSAKLFFARPVAHEGSNRDTSDESLENQVRGSHDL